MVIRKAEIITSAVRPAQYPNTGWPEIALAGRSMWEIIAYQFSCEQKSPCRIGNTPGRHGL